jgi:hypothetical protein
MTNLKTYFKELFEAETFKARSKESGKLVQFKSKDAYNAAVKAGTHEDPKAPKSGKAGGKDSKKDVPKANIFDKPSKSEPAADSMATVNSIASMTGLRTQAVAGWADENGVNLSKVADDIKTKKLKPMDFMTAVSGNPGNKYAKDIIAKYSNSSSSKASEPTSQSEPTSKPDKFGDKFELGTPAVYNDNGKEYSGEVVMNPSNQRVQIGGQWTTIGKGTTKGIQVYGSDTFIVPDNWNDVKGFDDATEKPAEQPKQPRKGNPQVNKVAKSAAEEAGITPQKLGKEEYSKTMYKAAIEALTDSNFHDEARELVAKLEGKPEWAKRPEYPSMNDPQYNQKMKALRTTGVDSSEYWDYDDNTGRYARKVSNESGWDGVQSVDAIAFTLRMNGFHKEADTIQSIFDNKPYMRETSLKGLFKETKYYKSNPKVLKEAFNAKDLPNWLFDDPVDFEDWYEDGMKLANNKGKIAPFSSSDEKKLFQLVGIWQDSEGDYQYGRGDYGTGKTTGARSASYTAQDDIKKFLTQKGKVVNETIKQKK